MNLVHGEELGKRPEGGPHRLTLEDRQHLSLTGVTDVDSFDDTLVLLRTNRGLMTVRGEGLQLKNLNLEGGEVRVDGTVSAIVYEQSAHEGGGFLRRLLG